MADVKVVNNEDSRGQKQDLKAKLFHIKIGSVPPTSICLFSIIDSSSRLFTKIASQYARRICSYLNNGVVLRDYRS